MKNLEKIELAKELNIHIDTLEHWEDSTSAPSPESALKLSNYFNVPIKYFDAYYEFYFSDVIGRLKLWKEQSNLTYEKAAELLNISRSAFGRLLGGKIQISRKVYEKLKEINAME